MLKELTEDIFKDPMKELIDKYAGEAEARDKEAQDKENFEKEKALNATRDAAAKAKADQQAKEAASSKNKTREVLA